MPYFAVQSPYGYNTYDPSNLFTAANGFDGIVNYVRPGQVYFKIDS